MGVIIPQVITPSRATGGQVIDGSLNFSGGYLKRTPGSAGNRKTFTWSAWVRLNELASFYLFNVPDSSGHASFMFDSGQLRWNTYSTSTNGLFTSNAYFRDTGWYHVVFAFDATESTTTDRIKVYVNGERLISSSYTAPDGSDTPVNNTVEHNLGANQGGVSGDVNISNNYLIDGQALGPEYFGFSDGLTNTWKPKKYEGTFGTNGFWLPMDGSTPIGQDQSGQGNNWTPAKFGGSLELDNSGVSGARPILNTVQGGAQAGSGVFGSKEGFREVVSSSSGSGNPYIFVTRGTQPTLSFIRGATYIFDYSGATSHPLRFATAADAAGSTQYTDGTSVSGNVISFTVPHNAPDTLYYYCTNHSGMGNSISVTTDETKADPYAWKCVLACPLTGNNIDVSNEINCTSTTKVMTTVGDAAASSVTSNFYNGSFFFDGSGDGITTPDNTDFEFGSGDFTIECWVRQDDTSGFDQFVGKYGGSGDGEYIVGKNGNTPTFYWQDSGGNNNINATNFTGNTDHWYHMACVREGNAFTMYINGICENSTTDSTTLKATSNKLTIAIENDESSSAFDGYLQDVRIYKGVAKYSGTTVGTQYFIPPSTDPDILPDTPSGVSGGSKLTKITDGAVAFNGSDQYLSVADNADFTVGSNPFTIEFYAYKNESGEDFFCGSSNSGGQTASMSYSVQTGGGSPSNSLRAMVGDGSTLYTVNSGKDFPMNRWVHVAFVRDGNTLRLFQDGIQVDTTSFSGTVKDSADPFMIGRGFGANSHKNFPGFISNFRFIKGTALYTSSFTPPTEPLTNVTNTKLLCCQSNSEGPQKTAVIPSATGTATAMWPLDSDLFDDSGNSNDLSQVNGATGFVSAGPNPFGLTNCANFVANNRYLAYAVTPASAWTIDGYIKFDDVNTGSNSYVLGWDGTDGSKTTIGLTKANSTFTVWGSSNLSTSTVAVAGRWYHVRLTTSSTSDLALYVDGVLAGRSTTSNGDPGSPITIGDMMNGRFHGKIAGVRYTPTDLGAPPLGGETTSNGVTSNSPPVGVSLGGNVIANNLTPFNTDINAVRGRSTSYPTFNPLDSALTLSDGNLNSGNSGASSWKHCRANMAMTTGKFYWEYKVPGPAVPDGNNGYMTGVMHNAVSLTADPNSASAGIYGRQHTTKYANGSVTTPFASAAGKTVMFAFDADAGLMWTGQDGTWYNGGNPSAGDNETWSGVPSGVLPMGGSYGSSFSVNVNFGQKPFKFPPPDGFQPLSSTNTRPDKVISRPNQYVGVITYSGNGGTQVVSFASTMNFDGNPDLVWIKATNQTDGHMLFDTVRGVENAIKSNNNNTPVTESGSLTNFGKNSITLGNNSNAAQTNQSSFDYVAWCWKAGGDKDTYNIDNVGYSTSADVGFDAGGLNDVAYNSSRTWSSNIVTTGNSGTFHGSFPATNAFNGNHSNYAHGNGDGAVSATVTLTFSPAIACKESVTFMGGFTNTTAGTGTISINGGPTTGITTCMATDPAATDLTVVPFTGDISTIVINKTSGGAQGMIIYGFKIDGVELLDNGVTPTYNYPTAPSTGCSVGTKQGFSIVSYTGNSTNPSTRAHGLLKAPQFVIIKNLDRSTNGDWIVGHADAAGTQLEKNHRDYGGFKEGNQLILSSANAVDGGSSNYFSNARPDRFTFTVKDNYQVNYAGENYIAYLWHDVPGLQKFGYYIGNGSSDGTYVELGFRPALLWIKNAFTGNETWCAHDSKRDPFNLAKHRMSLESANPQTTANSGPRGKDLLSNGFKIRGTSGEHNTNGDRYIYCAWAEAPAVDLFGGGANAR